MRRLGGGIEASNAPRGGAVFTLRFPRLSPDDAAIAARRTTPALREDLPPLRILVVDDDEDNLDASRSILEEMRLGVEVTLSGSDAIGRVEAGARYDLVLCDFGMPGLDGWCVARRLGELRPRRRSTS